MMPVNCSRDSPFDSSVMDMLPPLVRVVHDAQHGQQRVADPLHDVFFQDLRDRSMR